MTDSNVQTETWKPIPGFAIRYQASTGGQIRNRNGLIMSTRPNGSGYLQLDLIDDAGEPQTRTVHKLILRTFRGECPEGMEACHGPGGQLDNRLANLEWGPIADNRRAPSPRRPVRQPKPKAACILCGQPVTKGGRRCHDCVEKTGVEATALARGGMRLEDVNDEVAYGNAVYLHALMVKYGNWGHCPNCSCVTVRDVTLRERLPRLMRRFGKRGGDGQ